MQTADCRLGLNGRLRLNCRDLFSIYDLYIGNKKVKSKPFNAKSWNVIGEKFINHLSNSQI